MEDKEGAATIEFIPASKTQESLAADHATYCQRILQTEDLEQQLKDQLEETQDNLKILRGCLAYIEAVQQDLQGEDGRAQRAIIEAQDKPPEPSTEGSALEEAAAAEGQTKEAPPKN